MESVDIAKGDEPGGYFSLRGPPRGTITLVVEEESWVASRTGYRGPQTCHRGPLFNSTSLGQTRRTGRQDEDDGVRRGGVVCGVRPLNRDPSNVRSCVQGS